MRIANFKIITSNFELRTPNSNGFSLIEAIITLAVLSIAAIGVLSVFTVGTKGSANPLIIDQATQLAQGELEQNIGEKITNTFGSPSLTTNATPTTCLSFSPAPPLAGYTCTRTVCFVSPGSLDDTSACTTATAYKRIAVTMTNTATGQGVTAVTLVTNY